MFISNFIETDQSVFGSVAHIDDVTGNLVDYTRDVVSNPEMSLQYSSYLQHIDSPNLSSGVSESVVLDCCPSRYDSSLGARAAYSSRLLQSMQSAYSDAVHSYRYSHSSHSVDSPQNSK